MCFNFAQQSMISTKARKGCSLNEDFSVANEFTFIEAQIDGRDKGLLADKSSHQPNTQERQKYFRHSTKFLQVRKAKKNRIIRMLFLSRRY